MLVERLNRLIVELREDGFVKKDCRMYLFEHSTKPNKMAVIRAENDTVDLTLCYQVNEDGDIQISVEEMPIRDGVQIENNVSETDICIEDDELTDVTIDILTKYNIATSK